MRVAAICCALCTGCVVDGAAPAGPCDPGFVRDGDLCVEATGRLDVAWDPDPDCPDGASTAQVVSVNDAGIEYVDLFWCDDFAGVTAPLPLGRYRVQVNLVDESEVETFARSASQPVELVRYGETEPLDFAFVADRGFVTASWGVAGGCSSAGIATVELVEGEEILASADCKAATIASAGLVLGPHDLFLRALAGDRQSIVAATAVQSVDLEFGNELVDLGRFEL